MSRLTDDQERMELIRELVPGIVADVQDRLRSALLERGLATDDTVGRLVVVGAARACITAGALIIKGRAGKRSDVVRLVHDIWARHQVAVRKAEPEPEA